MAFYFLFAGVISALMSVDRNRPYARYVGIALLAASLVAAIFESSGVSSGLLLCVLLVIGVVAIEKIPLSPSQRTLGGVVITLAALIVGLGKVGHFPLFDVYSGAVISTRYPHPLAISGRFDKGFAGCIVLLLIPLVECFKSRNAPLKSWWIVLASIIALGCFALGSGILKPDVKIPIGWERFVISNILISCAAEEALFRGVIFSGLARMTENLKAIYSTAVTIGVSTILFTAVHGGPPAYLLLVFFVGAACGFVRYKTGSINASLITHAGANMVHFFLLSYPLP